MACIIYKGAEKLFVDPTALDGMLAQGWSTEPQELTPAPSAEDYAEFLNLHEELKRVSDTALSLRDDQIAELVNMNEVLTEENSILEAENLELKYQLENALGALGEKSEEPDKVAHKNWADMKIQTLKDHAKRANITGYANMRKADLIDALQIREMQDGPPAQD